MENGDSDEKLHDEKHRICRAGTFQFEFDYFGNGVGRPVQANLRSAGSDVHSTRDPTVDSHAGTTPAIYATPGAATGTGSGTQAHASTYAGTPAHPSPCLSSCSSRHHAPNDDTQ
jgi:hypothetical protein